MKLAYICSPYRGEVARNKAYARELTRLALDVGFTPVTPHLYMTECLDDNNEKERRKGLEAGLELVARCNIVIVGTRYGISEGMKEEIKLAARLDKLIWYEDREASGENNA